MALTDIIDQVHALIDQGAHASKIKPLLITLHDQAAALELRLQQMDAKLHDSVAYSDYEAVVADRELVKKDAQRFREAYENLNKQNAASHAQNVAHGLQGMPVPFEVRHLHDGD